MGLLCTPVTGQHNVFIKAELNDSIKSLYIQQNLEYRNLSKDTLQEIYLSDWMNAFSDTRTPLARRFFEDYDRSFHFAREEKRGGTTINSILGESFEEISWERPMGQPDLIKITPDTPVLPGEKFVINLNYSVKIPSNEFTRYGYQNKGNYQLRYWFIAPGMYNEGWEVYSHKNMNDLYLPKLEMKIELTIPSNLAAISSFEMEKIIPEGGKKTVFLSGSEKLDTEIHLTKEVIFNDIQVDSLHILTNISEDGINPVMKSFLVTRIVEFLKSNLGDYPHRYLLSSQQDYAANPVYGLNQLPKFLRPFPEGFSYDLKQLKTISENYLENTLLLNPREDKWIFDAIQNYLMMEYIDEFYADLKLLGSLSEVFGVRWFHASTLKFNDQYSLMYMMMARKNLDQPLSTPQDSLVKFNKNIANPSKAGVGLKYLDHFLEDNTVPYTIKEFYQKYQLKRVTEEDFKNLLTTNAGKDIRWFFREFVETNDKIDFKIRSLSREGDSLRVTLKNRTGSSVPVQVYGLHNNDIVYKTWVEHSEDVRTVYLPATRVNKVAVNHEGLVPEINRRNNYRTVGGIMNKPLQFRLFKDVEDPRYHQVFFMPEFQYNLYDGLALGLKLYNKTILDRSFQYNLSPYYASGSKTLVGSAGVSHQIFFDDDNLYALNYGISGSRFSYGYDLMYQRLTPYLTMHFRNSYMRNGRKERILIRNVNVFRDQHPETPLEVPDYSVFNINYGYSNPGLVTHFSGGIDFQVAEQFSKSSLTFEYRRLLKNDRQLNFRFFGGAFLYNDMPGSDYFSFALDRPTDYLFDYNYYGRSETSGVFSQQIILAEGGFKSMLEPKFANQWITTVNGSVTLWKWIYAYSDVGLVKNKYESAKFLYDSGIRLSLVQHYFEIFFPVYSSEGWEFKDGDYDQKIRFIATLDLQTLAGLFTRKWF
ncbi:gluzincin family metallopeptidase [Salinimicrobium xinjiangense]|uniref:metalloprotease n=1 Tax=Salinimicrobium xinjiangense TaxID=438596 RepID=UPI0004906EBA|nr:metalloprotease [Salinimicrobium xinjiangense]